MMARMWESFGITTAVLAGAGVVAALALLVVLVAVLGGMRRALRITPWVLLAMTTVAILVATLGFGVGDPDAQAGLNLEPFTEIRRGLRAGASDAVAANVWGNVAMFVPIGLLLVWLLTSPLIARVIMATIAGIGLSVIIELAQLTLRRVADIDDVILNGSGALLGALVGMVTVLLWRLVTWIARSVRARRHPSAPAA
ncbi:VanZ family protein [Demequina sp. TTPB684]|uniref:VanZ family protein n=1 Tax=unclassified Demequina TaxID=2620311 RepID=UPI001CF231E8|nr:MULTISPECIES: VanZ family protein [unclassified Demequina]MCB2412288.1 VanZ family protein [Demequina sp. TTPB684]UPU87568.1 VanZ family protein [Demequina sp. TMPB413]